MPRPTTRSVLPSSHPPVLCCLRVFRRTSTARRTACARVVSVSCVERVPGGELCGGREGDHGRGKLTLRQLLSFVAHVPGTRLDLCAGEADGEWRWWWWMQVAALQMQTDISD